MITHEHAVPNRLVAIKRVRLVNKTSLVYLRPYKSNQVVDLIYTYVDSLEIVLIYKAMDISLR